MKRNELLSLVLSVATVLAALAFPGPSLAASTTDVVPASVSDQRGLTVGSVAVLATQDQSGAQNNAAAYVSLTTPSSAYIGQYAYALPSGVSAASVTSIQLQVNFRGPKKASQLWTWQMYDWKSKGWAKVGNNAASDGKNWTLMTFTLPAAKTARYINANGQIKVRVKSSTKTYDSALDYMVVKATTAPVAHPPADSQPAPYAVSGTWRQVWGDEFNGTSLDLTKWEPNWWGKTPTSITQGVASSEGNCFDPANLSEGNGELDMKLIAKTCPASAGTSAGMPYTGSIITSRPHYTFTFGVVETRMWFNGKDATHCNNWDSFWINGLAVSTREEYDVAECLSNGLAFHLNPGNTVGGRNGSTPTSNGWHIFTVDWEPSGATVYYDKVKIGTISKTPYTAPMYIMYENATHGTTNVVAPDVMKIDYVRVWQK